MTAFLNSAQAKAEEARQDEDRKLELYQSVIVAQGTQIKALQRLVRKQALEMAEMRMMVELRELIDGEQAEIGDEDGDAD